MAISMLKIRRPLGRLIFNMGIAIPGKTVFLIETAPCFLFDIRIEQDQSMFKLNDKHIFMTKYIVLIIHDNKLVLL